METPRPYVAALAGSAEEAPSGSVPIKLYGDFEGGEGGGTVLPENTTWEAAVLVSDGSGGLSWLKVSDLSPEPLEEG